MQVWKMQNGSRPTLPYVMDTGALSPGVKRQERKSDHSPRASAEVKKTWICTSTLPYTLVA
jgi:hypothetical protein